MFGANHAEYGELAVLDADWGGAVAMSVGNDPESPSLAFKGDAEHPNEDAVGIRTVGSRVLLVAADAHFGHRASHVWVERMLATPLNLEALRTALRPTLLEVDDALDDSETSLVVALFDRSTGRGAGFSYGDSTFTVLREDGGGEPLNSHDSEWIGCGAVEDDPARFAFEASPGDLLLAFTDGVNECCYGDAKRSVQPADLLSLRGLDAGAACRSLGQMALRGVREQPGGQDNVGIAAISV